MKLYVVCASLAVLLSWWTVFAGAPSADGRNFSDKTQVSKKLSLNEKMQSLEVNSYLGTLE